MSTPGWYPDPGGEPGRYRYWDGTSWSAQTTGEPPSERRSRRWIGPLIGGLVVIVLLAIAAVVVIRDLTGSTRLTEPVPSSTISAWDDSSPIPTETPTPSPSPSPSPSQQQEIACPDGQPDATANHPNDGRVHGGRLSFPRVASYGDPRPKYGLSWFYDVSAQSQRTEPGWESWFAVGEIAVDPGFEDPKKAAESSMQCAVNDNWFSQFESRTDIRNEKFTIDGHDGWILASEIRVGNPSLSVEGDVVTIVMINDGRDDRLSAYVGIVPIGDAPRNQLADETLAGLRVG